MNAHLEELAHAIAKAHGHEGALLVELYAAVAELAPATDPPPPYEPPPPGGEPELVEPFAPGSPYAYLPDAPAGSELLGWWPKWINNLGEGEPYELAQLLAGDYLGTDAASDWGQHGPAWAARLYRCRGTARGVRVFRAGDFTAGREGHAFYLSPMRGDVLLEECDAIGCGAQHTQVATRAGEVPEALWPLPGDLFEQVRCRSVQNGAIQQGAAVRASWARSFFNTGSRYRAIECYTQTDHTGHQPAGSTGAVFVGFDKTPRRCELVELYRETCALRGSDRAAVFLEGVDAARLEECDLRELDRPAARVRIVDGCGPVRILRPRSPILVEFAHENDETGAAHRAPYRTELVPAGVDVWTS